jgi:cysteinyl-tRNA synthetase
MTRCIAIGVAALTIMVALGARAQTAKWDQEAVTTAAGQLEAAVSGLRDAVRKSNTWTSSPDKSELYEISESLRQIEWLATNLHADLKQGEELEATLPVYNQMLETREYARAEAEFVDISDSIRPRLEAARAALKKLGAFYPNPDAR